MPTSHDEFVPVPRRRSPPWARLCTVVGALVMVAGGAVVALPRLASWWVTAEIPQVDAVPSELIAHDIDGPINLLLLGIDQRNGDDAEDRVRADSIIIVHIPASHDRIFMISLPRDAEVAIPDYSKTGFRGYRDKINSAFAFGAVGPDGHRDTSPAGRARGAELTMLTINDLIPGGLTFNGAAIIDFEGFSKVLEAIGGVTICVDMDVYSIHYRADGTKAENDLPDGTGYHYAPGCQELQPWQALDFSRQRHVEGGDYTRQRHQQLLIRAIVEKVATGDPLALLRTAGALRDAGGELLTLDLGGLPLTDWIFTLKSLRPDDIVMVKTNGGQYSPNGHGSNEALLPETMELLASISGDTMLEFLTRHPDWIARTPT